MTSAPHASIVGERPLAPPLGAVRGGAEAGRAIYRTLTGCDPGEARIDTEHDFDAHVLASIIAVATTEDGPLLERIGLPAADLMQLVERWFPHARAGLPYDDAPRNRREDDELVMVRDLLLANRSDAGDESRWLAHMVARRAVEPSHLWEDLGLRNRAELSCLLARHFAPLASRNTRGMRWKRFFYRLLCEDDGFVMCTTPVCTDCCDFDNCFGEEDGDGRLARRRRDAASPAA